MKTWWFSFLFALLGLLCFSSFARDRDDNILTCLEELQTITDEFNRRPMDLNRGLVTANVKMTTTSLIEAYLRGIFPWITGEDGRILWYNPKLRGILPIDRPIEEIIPSRDWQFIRNAEKNGYVVTHNQAFERTMQECAKVRRYDTILQDNGTIVKKLVESTWIKEDFLREYPKLFRMGKADSYEVWREGKFAGGLYGVDIGGRFSGESMCSIDKGAAKLAMARLILDQQAKGRTWIDTQQVNGFLGPIIGRDGKKLSDGWGGIEVDRDKVFKFMVDAAEQAALPLVDF